MVGERHRHAGAFVADSLFDLFERRDLPISILLRGAEGFGAHHPLRTARLLTLSEDLPVVAVAVGDESVMLDTAAEVAELLPQGLIAIERIHLATGMEEAEPITDFEPGQEAKLTIYCGRRWRDQGRAAHLRVVEALHDQGVAGAATFLGVDGTVHGHRTRARFLSANRNVPTMTIAVGQRAQMESALVVIRQAVPDAIITIERVRVCRRDGRALASPIDPADVEGAWHRFTVYTGSSVLRDGQPISAQLVRALRGAGALGATTTRGIWGYHGDHQPHGDSFWRLRRRVPAVVTCIDRAERTEEIFEVINAAASDTGLVTSEFVPVVRTHSGGATIGGLQLPAPR